MLRRALRHAFTILSAQSLLLCVALIIAGTRSHFRADKLYGQTETRLIWAHSEAGRLVYLHYAPYPPPKDGKTFWNLQTFRRKWGKPSYPDDPGNPITVPRTRALGFEWTTGPVRHPQHRPPERLTLIVVPYWGLVVLAGLWPITRMTAMVRTHRRDRSGLCSTCGYDLRAHTGGERCPECGTSVQTAP